MKLDPGNGSVSLCSCKCIFLNFVNESAAAWSFILKIERKMILFRGFSSLILAVAASWSLNALAQPASSPAATAAPMAGSAAAADQTVLMRGPAGDVTLWQVRQALETMVSAAQRDNIFTSPRSIEQFALSVYTRRALTAQAQKAGFDHRPEVVQALAEGQQLPNLWLEHQVKEREPTPEQLEKYARSVYEAQPPKRVGDMSAPAPDFESQRTALMEQARAKLASQVRTQTWNEAKDGAEPDVDAIAAQVRPPAGR
ncbi:MAG: hypothetical protein WBC18_22140 [Ottowia sp.]|uniref:hypothetical protein n=1 Tax=Ottowia sp. TaxID=1898956 RepID=UPI003C786174